MKFYCAVLAWLVIAALLVAGVVMATKGSFLLLGLGMLGFVGTFAKYGCSAH